MFKKYTEKTKKCVGQKKKLIENLHNVDMTSPTTQTITVNWREKCLRYRLKQLLRFLINSNFVKLESWYTSKQWRMANKKQLLNTSEPTEDIQAKSNCYCDS